jgi:hypothetical protein
VFLRSSDLILADVLPSPPQPTTQNFNYCIRIVKIENYPDRLFFFKVKSRASSTSTSSYRSITAKDCIKLERGDELNIFAISKNTLTSGELTEISSSGILNNARLEKSLIVNYYLLVRPDELSEEYHSKNIEVTHEIESIDKKGINTDWQGEKITQMDNSFANLVIFLPLGLLLLATAIGWKRQRDRLKS